MLALAKKKTNVPRLNENKLIAILSLVFIITRLINLTLIPIFNDEATYLDWGWRHINLDGELFHSVKHAKPPLLMWIFGLAQKIISDPLAAGRLVSVATGYLTALGLYQVAKKLINKKGALISFFLYIIIPIFVFYDRQALMESAVTTCGVWSFYFLLKSIESEKLKYPVILGAIIGIGYFVKSNAFVFFISAVFIFLAEIKSKRTETSSVINKVFFLSITALLILSPLLSQDIFWKSLNQNEKYTLTFNELASIPLNTWLTNIKVTLEILLVYFNPFIFLIGIYGIYKSIKTESKYVHYLLIWFILGIVITNILGRTMQIRHLTSYLPFFVIFVAFVLSKISLTSLNIKSLIYLAIIPSVITTILLIFSPLDYFSLLNRFTQESLKKQYVTLWSSGYGFDETKQYLEGVAKNKKIIVGVRLDAGIPENAVFTYFNGSNNIFPIYLDSQIIPNVENVNCFAFRYPTFFVSRDANYGGLDKFLVEELARFGKPEGDHYVGIHKVKVCEDSL